MPLLGGWSRAAVSENIRRLRREGYSQGQAVAIAFAYAREQRRRILTRNLEKGRRVQEKRGYS